jgi:hypothetical protein
MFIKLNYQECCALINMIEELTDHEARSADENKALEKLRAIAAMQKIKYNARQPKAEKKTA